MTTLYKLTDRDNKTRAGQYNECTWGPGVSHEARIEGTCLCTPQVIHAYEHPLMAVLMNPIHADFMSDNMKMWRAEGEVVAREGQAKCGVKKLTTIEEIEVPQLTQTQRIRFAILAALEICDEPQFVCWALGWLSGSDRSTESAKRMYSITSSIAARACQAVYAQWLDKEAFLVECIAERSLEIDLFRILEEAVLEP